MKVRVQIAPPSTGAATNAQPVDGPEFERFMTLLREHPQFWSKVTCPDRLTVSGPPYNDDFVPRIASTEQARQQLLVDNPTRLYWGDRAGV